MINIILSAFGISLVSIYFRDAAEMLPLVWGIAPYVISLILSIVAKSTFYKRILTGALLLTLTFEIWMIVDSSLGNHSDYLLALSLLVTLKGVILMPLGAGVGALYHNLKNSP